MNEEEKEKLIKSIIAQKKKIKIQKEQKKETKKIKDDLISFIWVMKEMKKKSPPKNFSNDNIELLMKKITEYEEEKCYRTLFDIYEVVETVTKPDWKEINNCKKKIFQLINLIVVYIDKIKLEMDFRNHENILKKFLKE